MADKKKEVPEEIQKHFKTIVDTIDDEDTSVRERQIKTWRKLKLYWDGFQHIFYSEVAHDWKVYDAAETAEGDNDAAYYDKPINIFRAYLESIIAALSIQVPAVACVPDDAEDPMDIATAKAGETISQLIYKHNDVTILWLHALYILCTEGMVACHHYSHEDDEYGTWDEKKYETDIEKKTLCPNCKTELPADFAASFIPPEISPEMMPEQAEPMTVDCPECGAGLSQMPLEEEVVIKKFVGIEQHPKSRQILEVYGGLFVKVPNYARKQKDCPYLVYSYETDYTLAIERWPHLTDKVTKTSKIQPGYSSEEYEAWGRLSPQYRGDYPTNTVTCREFWIRPARYNVLSDASEIAELKKLYPEGVKVTFINEYFADAVKSKLDDEWTLTCNPLGDYIHYDPLGMLLVSVQDITNDITSLVLQTIEQGIPQTFADPAILDFNAYRLAEATPGSVYPTKPVAANKNISEGFFTLKTSTLSGEVFPFAQRIQDAGQLVSGALPSLFGGTADQGSKTASEYAMSRAQALQRLQNSWKMLSYWWKNVMGKVIPSYMEDIVEDEKFVKKDNAGNYVNVIIRKSELNGNIGDIELEPAEQLPVTWAQQKDTLMQLIQLNNPEILEALSLPENIPYVRQIIGIPGFVLPGEDDRNKEYEEIKELLASEPIVIDVPPEQMLMAASQGVPLEQAAQPQEFPSVEIDPILDNHEIGAEVDRNWLIGDAGRLAKVENPNGYKNVLLHYKQHMEQLQMQMMQQQQAQMAMAQAGSNGAGTNNGQPKNAKGKEKSSPNDIAPPPIGDTENGKRVPIQ